MPGIYLYEILYFFFEVSFENDYLHLSKTNGKGRRKNFLKVNNDEKSWSKVF